MSVLGDIRYVQISIIFFKIIITYYLLFIVQAAEVKRVDSGKSVQFNRTESRSRVSVELKHPPGSVLKKLQGFLDFGLLLSSKAIESFDSAAEKTTNSD